MNASKIIFLLLSIFILNTYALKAQQYYSINKTNIKLIQNKGWSLQNKDLEGGFTLANDNKITGGDGCNGFWGKYEIDEKNSRIVFDDIISTEKECPNKKNFSIYSISSAKFFVIKKNKLIFYDNDKKEISIFIERKK